MDIAIRDKRTKHSLFVHPARKPLPEAIRIPEDEGAAQLDMDLEIPCDGGVRSGSGNLNRGISGIAA